MKVRTYMISRFSELKKTLALISVQPATEEGKFDIEFEGNVILRVTAYELAALKLKVSK